MGLIGFYINGSLFILWCVLASVVGIEDMLPAMAISGMFTITSALTIGDR